MIENICVIVFAILLAEITVFVIMWLIMGYYEFFDPSPNWKKRLKRIKKLFDDMIYIIILTFVILLILRKIYEW